VIVGATAPSRPPNQAATAPNSSATATIRAPREVTRLATAAPAACQRRCPGDTHILLHLHARFFDRDVLRLGQRFGGPGAGIVRLPSVAGYSRAHAADRCVAQGRGIIATKRSAHRVLHLREGVAARG